jgi:hypothetical protein
MTSWSSSPHTTGRKESPHRQVRWSGASSRTQRTDLASVLDWLHEEFGITPA